MKIASIQLNIEWEDKEVNFRRSEIFTERAKSDNCNVIVFPETFNSGFSMNVKTIGEVPNGETFDHLSQLAKKYNISIIGGYAESTNSGKGRNIALVLDSDGRTLAKYSKNHPFSYVDEHKYYEPGDSQSIFEIDGTSSSVFICYDLRFPELFRKVAKQVSVIFVIANWPLARQEQWESLLKARAIENQCFIVGVNRIGTDGNELTYGGGSNVFDPLGNMLSRGGSTQEYIVTEINESEVTEVRRKFPFLKDMKYI